MFSEIPLRVAAVFWVVPIKIKISYRRQASISLKLQDLFDMCMTKVYFLVGFQATTVTIETTTQKKLNYLEI